MAKYRLYKNGVFGHRYKGYYIVKNETDGEKSFSILDAEKHVVAEHIGNYDDTEWEIDKMAASPEMLQILKDLYAEELFMLSKFMIELMQKDGREGLTADERSFYDWVKKIRKRKSENKAY